MKATCTQSPDHNVFYTTAHVVEEWKVDREGNFLSLNETVEVTHKPNRFNKWECAICGSLARVEP